jgi:hypothetical protein
LVTSIAIAAAVALVTASGVSAAKPDRFVYSDLEGFVADAGVLCAFPVQGEPVAGAHQTVTVFSDGREQTIGHGGPILTNLDTGQSIAIKARFKATTTFDATANTVVFDVNGRIVWFFGPGDPGPFGAVDGTNGLFLISGHSRVTIDLTAGVYTSFEWSGAYTDLCAELADR